MYKNFFIVLLTFALLLIISSCKDDSTPVPPSENRPPNAPSNPAPADNAANVPYRPVNFSWDCSDPDPGDVLTYNLYLGEQGTPLQLIGLNLASASFTFDANSGTLYFWRVVARDNQGDSTSGPDWNFRTASSP